MKNKWLRYSWILIGLVAVLAACDKSKEQAKEIDARDAFVGTYAYEATGEVNLYAAGTKLYTFPLNDDGEFSIAKTTTDGQVVITGYNDSTYAFVSGNQLILESNSMEYTYGDLYVKMVLSYDKAMLEGKHLTWKTDIMALGTYGSYAINGDGHIDVTAEKKK